MKKKFKLNKENPETEVPEVEIMGEDVPEASEKAGNEAPTLADLQQEIDELEQKNLRLRADFENYRKRSYNEMLESRKSAVIDTLIPMLRVFDTFDMAMMAAENSDNIESLMQGMKMIQTDFGKALEEYGIDRIDANGKEFDPNLHEAVATEASDTVPEGQVIKQWNCGYKMGDRVIRPARVVVSSGPEE